MAKPAAQRSTSNVFDDGVEFDPKKVTEIKDLTTSFKWELNKDYFFRVTGKMYVREAREGEEEVVSKAKGKGKKGKAMEPPTMLPVFDLVTKRSFELILNAVPEQRLVENYPDDSYVGKCFRMRKGDTKQGKNYRYSPFDVAEIDPSGK